jgi:phenylalanyl-tRNA synthetase alpha chain
MPKIDLKKLKIETKKGIEKAPDLKGLNDVFNKYLGKKGELTQVLRSLEKLPKTKRVRVGKGANKLKGFLKTKFDQREQEIKERFRKSAQEAEWLDITVPGKRPLLGHLHSLTQVKRKVGEIFENMGFSIVEGPEVETEWYNFDALNIPQEHPARDFWDTLWLKENQKPKTKSQKLLLRTHTSPVQVRYLEKNQPPLKIIFIS